jgi:hypothetical protein
MIMFMRNFQLEEICFYTHMLTERLMNNNNKLISNIQLTYGCILAWNNIFIIVIDRTCVRAEEKKKSPSVDQHKKRETHLSAYSNLIILIKDLFFIVIGIKISMTRFSRCCFYTKIVSFRRIKISLLVFSKMIIQFYYQSSKVFSLNINCVIL